MDDLILGESVEELIDHRGKTPTKLGSSFVQSGIPVISAILVADGRLDIDNARFIDEETYHRWMPVPTRRGDVILTSEAPLGRVARVPDNNPLGLGQRVFGLRGRRGVLDSGFLYYALQTERVQADLLSRSTGTTVFGIRQSALRSIVIPAPSFDEQVAIADVLSALDDKIATNDRCARVALALGDELLVDSLATHGGTPTTIGELAEQSLVQFSDGYRTKKSEHGRPGLRILRAGDVRDSYVFPSGEDYVSQEYSRQIGVKASKPGDIVLTTKGTVGRVAVIAQAVETVVYSPQVCFFRVTDENRIDQAFLGAWFRSADLQRQAATLMFKSDMAPYISLRDIRSLVVPLPSIEDQRKVGNQQRALLGAFNASRAENASLARTRDELLRALMSGKARVKDAEAVASEAL